MIIKYEDFDKVNIRSGTIIKAEDFPKTKKPCFKIWADFGDEIGVLQTTAQITKHYTIQSLIGKQIAGCVNLGDKNIAWFVSQFILLGFPDAEGGVCIITCTPNVPNGQKLF